MASMERAPILACMVGSACSALARVFGYPKEGNQKLTLFGFGWFFVCLVGCFWPKFLLVSMSVGLKLALAESVV